MKKRRIPPILYIHGGPWGAFGNIYSIDFQLLAGAGYAVLFVNYHGSSGYGEAFGQSIQAAWGTLDYEDQMMALDHVIVEGLADPDSPRRVRHFRRRLWQLLDGWANRSFQSGRARKSRSRISSRSIAWVTSDGS